MLAGSGDGRILNLRRSGRQRVEVGLPELAPPKRPSAAGGPQTSVAATRQSAANFPVSGKECGALPRRRYARKILDVRLFEDESYSDIAILIIDQLGTPGEGTRPTRRRFCGV